MRRAPNATVTIRTPRRRCRGRARREHTSFDVDTVSLHIHERIDPLRIVKQVLKTPAIGTGEQPSLFEAPTENLTLDKEIDFYHHQKNWSNRLIAGDSLLVMNSLLQKEGMAGKVQMLYIDPPYGIKYNSNFQPYVNKRDVKDGDDDSIPAEPETIKAFRDTWELGIHSYLSYMRHRLLLARELLHESGSVFVQISDENVHLVRSVMDEVFGVENFVGLIPFRKKSMPLGGRTIENMCDYLLWYAKYKVSVKYNQLYIQTVPDFTGMWRFVELPNGDRRKLTTNEKKGISPLPNGSRIYTTVSQLAPSYSESSVYDFEFQGNAYRPPQNQCWVTTREKMNLLAAQNRLQVDGNLPRYILYFDDFPFSKLTNPWLDTAGAASKQYVVETSPKVIQRCILMTTDPGDLVFDITCGSGTTAYVAEQWGRRWITCDTSRVAVQLAKQRLMTAKYDYYTLAHPQQGVASGFEYETVPHITLKSIANDEPPKQETLYDRPHKESKKIRTAGPFTVEAVPGVRARPLDSPPPDVSTAEAPTNPASESLADYLDCLTNNGIRTFGNTYMTFSGIEIARGRSDLHAFATLADDTHSRCALVFGPNYAPMEQTQIERSIKELQSINKLPNAGAGIGMLIFCAYAFDPEASKDIDTAQIPDLKNPEGADGCRPVY